MRDALPDGMQTSYPNIAQACLSIALDNGGINRGRSIRKWAGANPPHFDPQQKAMSNMAGKIAT